MKLIYHPAIQCICAACRQEHQCVLPNNKKCQTIQPATPASRHQQIRAQILWGNSEQLGLGPSAAALMHKWEFLQSEAGARTADC